jgi:hypothetical protein
MQSSDIILACRREQKREQGVYARRACKHKRPKVQVVFCRYKAARSLSWIVVQYVNKIYLSGTSTRRIAFS